MIQRITASVSPGLRQKCGLSPVSEKLSPADAQGFRRFMDYNRVKLEKFAPC